jgi:hypothetical protein
MALILNKFKKKKKKISVKNIKNIIPPNINKKNIN